MVGEMDFDLNSAQADYIAQLVIAGTTFKFADIGKAVCLEAETVGAAADGQIHNGRLGLGSNNDEIYGILKIVNVKADSFNSGNNETTAKDDITVQNKGFAWTSFVNDGSDGVPEVGGSVVTNGAGAVKKAATGNSTVVHKVITENFTAKTGKVLIELR